MSITDNYQPDKSAGNGVTVNFSGNWNLISSAYIRVYWEDTTSLVQTLKVLGTHYDLAFTASGYTVTFKNTAIPPSTVNVIRSRTIAKDQAVPYKTSLGFQGAVQENSYDKITAMCQEVQEQINRAPKLPLGNSTVLTMDAPVAKKGLRWNDAGTGLINSTDDLDGILSGATAQAVIATAQAVIATTQAGIATADRVACDADAVATAADRVQTGIDRTAASTSAANALTSENNAEASEDLTAADAIATAADRVQTGLDAAATAADEAATDLDAAATAADRVQTGLDRTQTGSDATSSTASAAAAAASATLAANVSIQISTAAGSANAITATYSTPLTLTNLTRCMFVASAANTTATPTFAPDGLTAHTITKQGGAALVAGDIPAALAVCELEYNLANTRWELLNPAIPAKVVTQSQGNNSTSPASTAYADLAALNAAAAANAGLQANFASTANIAGTYTAVASGIGDFYTITATGAMNVDGHAAAVGEVFFAKDFTGGSGAYNGLYVVTVAGGLGISPVLTRRIDYDQASDINNVGAIAITTGTVNGGAAYILTTKVTNVGTDAMTYTIFTPPYASILQSGGALGTPASGTLSNCTTATQSPNDNSTKMASTAYADAAASGAGAVPTGTILSYGGTSAPAGYLGCDGTAVSRATYAGLFTAIGTTWGVGDGSTTFNVPDLRRRTAVGSGGSGTGTLGASVGNTGGEETHQLSSAEMASHTHSFSATTDSQGAHTHTLDKNTSGSGSAFLTANNGVGSTNTSSSNGAHTHSISGTSGSTGSDTAHNNMQPSAVVLKIIKT